MKLLKKLLHSKAFGWRALRMFLMFYVISFALVIFFFPKLALLNKKANSDPYHPVPESVNLTASDGITVVAELHKTPGAKKTLLISHGNAEHIGQLRFLVPTWQALGFHVMTYDYRGYGGSSGTPSERGIYRDIQAAWDYLVQDQGVAPADIVIYGRSIGGGPSTWLAARVDNGGLVLESSFVSALRVPLRGVRIFPMDPFPNIKHIDDINCPLLIVHGTVDRTIHPFHAERLFEAAEDPKDLLWIEGAGHNDVHNPDAKVPRPGPEYDTALRKFLQN